MKHAKINIYLIYVLDKIKKKRNMIEIIVVNNWEVFCYLKVFDSSDRLKLI